MTTSTTTVRIEAKWPGRDVLTDHAEGSDVAHAEDLADGLTVEESARRLAACELDFHRAEGNAPEWVRCMIFDGGDVIAEATAAYALEVESNDSRY